ncbi:uncharacterized protein LOC100842286 [Brachypodium distachyon]|uniref:Uncharacterized protein n=1 Tax=Brachypodium distachyon TaxID=15368 RepID=I1GNQ4_BRADI|nr:uncharacterized protein LOC100842286 [Brachypodium distachyon]KQK13397.1 hypothetical protein BRADI_1g09890v3 [Brachypodium distachyon]|eukprot:XP_003559469.2 uncharacterized protein LOC100842286 [Brachypodium distachyon]
MMSRRTRRADLQQQKQPVPEFAGTNTIVSNPIFSYEDGSGSTQLKPVDDVLLGCGYKEPAGSGQDDVIPDAVFPAAGAGVVKVKPLPLPPSMAHRLPASSSRAGPAALVMMARSQHGGWVLTRRAPHHDPFLAAYVACTKSGGKDDSSPATVKQQHRQRKKNETNNNTRGDDALRGCGIWSGWAAAAGAKKKKYAGAMSCKHGSAVAVAVQRKGDDPAQALASPGHPRLHLSRQLVVIPARKKALVVLPRGRAQGQR